MGVRRGGERLAGRRRGVLLGSVLAAALLTAGAALADPALAPWPRTVQVSDSTIPASGPFQVEWDGYRDAFLEDAVRRFAKDVEARTGLSGASPGARLHIAVEAADPGLTGLRPREDYRLAVTDDGVRLSASGPAGALRGLATLRQLLEPGGEGFVLPRVSIDDAPRFVWRGLMIDTARHFMTLPTLKRQIDAMERVKLNVLHLHLSDSEGFRVQSLRYPRLTEVVGGGLYYTQDEVRELVAYAAARGVRVVPEIDVPGHTGAILAAYPELSAGPVDPANRIGLMGLAMDPTKEETYAFIQGLFEEMAGLFPDAYFHVGGDEVQGAAWTSNPAIAAHMQAHGLADHVALQDAFFRRVKTIMDGLGKKTLGWEEIAHQPLEDDVVVHAWRSSQAISHVTAQNNPVIVSAGYYLDLLWPGERMYALDPVDPLATPPERPEQDLLGPAPTGPLSPEQAALVIGGEAAIWSEVVTDEMLDGRIWPRAALVAERFWSPAEVRDPADASRRIVRVQEGLRIEGLRDQEHRHRMAARLAPADAATVEVLASATGPVRNFGRLGGVIAALRAGRPLRAPELNTLADVAAPDSVEAHRLAYGVDRFLKGGRGAEVAALRAQLALYRDNHARFAAAAPGVEALEQALPISEDVSALARLGLEAMAMIEAGRTPEASWRDAGAALLKRQDDAEAASASNVVVWSGVEQPPANLLIIITPSIRRLFEAAAR